MMTRRNNFDIIRLIAALGVIVSHGFDFAKLAEPLKALTHEFSIGGECVYVFFLISGYLISKSWLKLENVKIYFANRVLRIFPGLVAVVFISILIIGPVFTNLSLKAYFSDVNTYKYLQNISLAKLHYTLPGVFVFEEKAEHTFNAPLWTLVFEFMMYLIVPIYGMIGILKPTKWGLAFFVGIYLFFLLYTLTGIPADLFILKIKVKFFVLFYLYFFAGVLFNLYQKQIKLSPLYIIPLVLTWYYSIETPFIFITTLALTAFIVFYLAFIPYSFGSFITRYGDFSYGIYLYGYIAQNIVKAVMGYNSFFGGTAISIALTIPLAALSWYYIESKALKLKPDIRTGKTLASFDILK